MVLNRATHRKYEQKDRIQTIASVDIRLTYFNPIAQHFHQRFSDIFKMHKNGNQSKLG